jgi:hypothetical protein
MPSAVAQKAIELLSPTVGDFVARAKVAAACKLAHVGIETLGQNDLPVFSDKLQSTCENLGKSIAAQIKERALHL